MSGKHSGEPFSAGRQAASNAAPLKPRKGTIQGNAPLLTDAQILELRALHDFAGWNRDALMLRYGVDKDMIQRVVTGITRSRLVATLKHLPAGVKPR
jgi:hypothetical protein